MRARHSFVNTHHALKGNSEYLDHVVQPITSYEENHTRLSEFNHNYARDMGEFYQGSAIPASALPPPHTKIGG